jgi:hypothetical protein
MTPTRTRLMILLLILAPTVPAAAQEPDSWAEVGRPVPLHGDSLSAAWGEAPRTELLFRAGVHRTWSGLPSDREHSPVVATVDLGLLHRGDDGDQWGGAAAGYWWGSGRRTFGAKAIRRWRLDPAPDTYWQVAAGVTLNGSPDGPGVDPALVLEAELGNRWLAAAAGLHVQPWNASERYGLQDDGTALIGTAGVRAHGVVGLGVVLAAMLAFVIAFSGDTGGLS